MGNTVGMGLFYGRMHAKQKGMDIPSVDFEIRTKQAYVNTLTWIMMLLAGSAIAISLVPGAGTGGPVVTFSSMPRIIWLMPTVLICAYTLYATGFDSQANVPSTAMSTIVSLGFQVFGIVCNLILGISVAIELNNGTSTFVLQNSGAWAWVFVIGAFVFFLWGGWIAWRLYVYWADILEGSSMGWKPGIVTEESLSGGKTEMQPLIPQTQAPPQQQQQEPSAPPVFPRDDSGINGGGGGGANNAPPPPPAGGNPSDLERRINYSIQQQYAYQQQQQQQQQQQYYRQQQQPSDFGQYAFVAHIPHNSVFSVTGPPSSKKTN